MAIAQASGFGLGPPLVGGRTTTDADTCYAVPEEVQVDGLGPDGGDGDRVLA